MPQTDTKRGQVILNTLTKAEYDSASKNATQLYGLKDTHELYLGNNALSRNTAYEAGTNCVTFIPNDIILELNSGTLTLKAGSKVYIPNGANTFDTYTIETNRTYAYSTGTSTRMLFYNKTAGGMQSMSIDSCFSGDTAPSSSGYWYDTANNKVKRSEDSGATWDNVERSLPIAIIQVTNGSITNIEKVFNGFGYIGNLIFVLPGVRGIYPNGRNSDGTLKNTEVTTTNVITGTGTYSGNRHLMLSSNHAAGFINVFYDKYRNILWNNENDVINRVNCGTFTRGTDGVITAFDPKVSFRATDYDDFARLFNNVSSISSSLNSLDSNAMKLTGDQTAAGAKTFLDFIRFNGSASRVATWKADVTPQSDGWCDFQFRDNTDTWFGTVGIHKRTNGDLVTRLQARKQDGSSNYGNLEIGFTANGQLFTSAPTPTDPKDNSRKIATTEWVNGRRATSRPTSATSTASAAAPDYIVENGFNSSLRQWYIKFSSGLMIIWGYCVTNNGSDKPFDDDDPATVTFAQPFKDFSTTPTYVFIKNVEHYDKSSTYHRELGLSNKTSSGGTTYAVGNKTSFMAIGWYK